MSGAIVALLFAVGIVILRRGFEVGDLAFAAVFGAVYGVVDLLRRRRGTPPG